jgi:hypothetical protein
MSTSVTGRLVDEHQAPLPNLKVLVRDESALFSSDLGSADSLTSGQFTVPVPADLTPEMGTRRFGISVLTKGQRTVYSAQHDDATTAALDLGDIQIRQADVSGWTVTLLGSAQALPVRDGNTIRILVDDEDAWSYLESMISGATTSFNLMQLEFDIPGTYDPAPPQERPEIVISFGSPVDPAQPRKVLDPDDYRPERMFLDGASKGKKVRVLIGHNGMLNFLTFVKNLFGPGPLGRDTDVASYFGSAKSNVKTAPFNTTWFNVAHAKIAIADDGEVLVLGSPFSQSYWDTHQHHVFEPRRGSAAGETVPVHDVSAAVRGPAVKDAHDAYILHWNRDAATADQITAISLPTAITTPKTGEVIASLQLVRTINGGAFTAMPDGELGVLEAYLRAIENAKDFIYFENQYFTNDKVVEALITALNDTTNRPKLQVILMLNIRPDLPWYPTWQGKRIANIRKGAGANASRFGVFNAWTHDPPMPSRKRTKPMIIGNYLHSKVAVVDGVWATIGSANLDGASLDYYQFLHLIQFGDNRNHELNYLIFNGIDGHPATDAVDKLRVALWSEHLGIDPSDPRLANAPADGWLSLWKTCAETKRSALETNPTDVNPSRGRVLTWPDTAKPDASYEDILKIHKVDLTKIDLVDSTTPFSFHDGTWA